MLAEMIMARRATPNERCDQREGLIMQQQLSTDGTGILNADYDDCLMDENANAIGRWSQRKESLVVTISRACPLYAGLDVLIFGNLEIHGVVGLHSYISTVPPECTPEGTRRGHHGVVLTVYINS